MKRLQISLFLALVSVFSAMVRASTVTAAHTYPPTTTQLFNTRAGMGVDGILYDNRDAQTFTSTTDGILNTISFTARKSTGTTADLRVTVTDVIGGQPGAPLATALVNRDLFAVEDYRYWDICFTTKVDFHLENVLLETGETYAIVFSSDTITANYRLYGDYTVYVGGSLMRFQNSGPYRTGDWPSDLYFEVTVNSIPEPSAITLLLMGTVSLNRRKLQYSNP